ncbi:MAG: hypothetical protein ACLFTE_00530 [Salinivenus sp.]
MPPNDSSLTRYLDTLYPVACMLAGPDAANPLLRHTFERAADTPPKDRPSDRKAWLLRLLIDTHSETAGTPGPKEGRPDGVRRAVAEDAVARVLPAAFVTGSETERLILTLDALEAPTDTLAQVLHTSAEAAEANRAQAWTDLSDRVRDALPGPQRALVEETISREHLRTAVREDLTGRFETPPSSLRSVLRAILQRGEADGERHDNADTTPPDDSSSAAQGASPNDNEQTSGRPWRRMIVGGALLVLLVAGAVFAVSQLSSSSPPPSTLSSLSAAAADTLRPTRELSDPTAARSYIQDTWQRRVAVPSIEGASLRGIGQFRFGDAEVPAVVFAEDDASESITVLAFNYALLDRLEDQLQVDNDLRTALAENQGLLSRSEADTGVVLWRQRDDILVAVAPHLSADALEARIAPGGDSSR